MRSAKKPRRVKDPDPAPVEHVPLEASTSAAEATALVHELLRRSGAALSSGAAKRIQALGQAAVAPLVAVLIDSRLRAPNAPAGGWAPVHAARLLKRLDARPAIEPLLDVLATTDRLSPLGEAVSRTLAPLKGQLVGPILDRLPTAVGEYRRELWFMLAGCGVREARVFDQLLAALAEAPEIGAICLGEYGDPAALPELSRALDAHPLGLMDQPGNDQPVFELREAILELGGQLTAAQKIKYERALWTRRIRTTAPSEHLPQHPDSACACGSGNIYRLCCLQ